MTQIFVVDQGSGNTVDTSRLIDTGSFFDRFGAAKLEVLSSTVPVVAALVKDAQVRNWIDLADPAVGQGIDLIISAGGIAGVDKNAILNTPVKPKEQAVLMKVYFS